MLLAFFYYVVAFLIYTLLYDYYQNNARKRKVELDFLQSLGTIQINAVPTLPRKSFEDIKKELLANFYFTHLRIIFGIDLSASNEWQGRKTFNGQSLHKTQASKIYNPYQKAISRLGLIFEEIFSSKIEYSSFGFGDDESKDFAFFPIVGTGEEFHQHKNILDAYLQQTKNVTLSGPTSFTPIIKKLISYGIHYRKDFTLLILLTDELKMSHQDGALLESIRELTKLPNTCLIVIGVGDGPWERMSYEEHHFRELAVRKTARKNKAKVADDNLNLKHSYDNFHFVDFNCYNSNSDKDNTDNPFARAVLTKLPTQLKQAFYNNHNYANF